MKKPKTKRTGSGNSQKHKAPASWMKVNAAQRARKAVTKRRKKVGKY